MIGTLGYNEQAAGHRTGLRASLFLVLFSSRIGKLAARFGPRLFMSLGPAIMALGLLWLARIPADSQGWMLGGWPVGVDPAAGRLLTRPAPRLLVFGIALSIMVAPSHDRPDDLGPSAELGRSLGYQQRHLSRRLPTGERLDLRGCSRQLLRHHQPAGAQRRHRLPRVPQRLAPLNQPSAESRPRSAPPLSGLDRCLPPRDAGRRRTAHGRRRRQRLRDPLPAPAGRHPGPGAEQPPSESGRGPPAVQYRLEPRSSASNNHRPI